MNEQTVILILVAFVAGVLVATWPKPWRRLAHRTPPADKAKQLDIPSLDYRQGYKDGLADSHRALGGGRRV